MADYQEYMRRADETALSLTRSSQNWTAFLTTAARLYKYPYNEQLMIYAQRPDATACAEFDIWNKRVGRYIKRGSKGIMLAGTQGTRYVFDVADTGTRNKSRPFKLWEYSDKYEQAIQTMFADKYDSGSGLFFNMVNDAVRKSANEYWQDNHKNIIYTVANSFLEGYDDYNIKVKFIDAVFRSESLEWLKRVTELQEQTSEPIQTDSIPGTGSNIAVEPIAAAAPEPAVGNFHITGDNLGVGGAKAKFRANMDAVNLLKELELENRQATEEEQEILSRYVGWGSLPDAFDESKEAWADEFTELYTALSPE